MKIRLHQLNPTIGDLSGNRDLILSALKKAEDAGIDLLILPEMVVTGYPVQDVLERSGFRNSVYELNTRLIESTGSTALLFGSLTPNQAGVGRKMHNSAILARNGAQIGITHKTLLPTYDVFDDMRYFEHNTTFNCLKLDDVNLGVTICEDIWYNQNEINYHTYDVDPAEALRNKGADFIINISASPYTNTKHENRLHMLGKHALQLKCPVLYCNQVGAHTEIVFEGDSMAINPDGKPVVATKAFSPSFADISFDAGKNNLEKKSGGGWYPESKEERQFHAIKLGLSDYMEKTGVAKKVVLGLSGGIDSALVAALAAETIGPENVHAITMPSEFSSEGSITDSQILADNLGIKLDEIPIHAIYEQFNDSLKPLFGDMPFGVAEENLQSRIRGALLMAYSNKYNAFLLATGNKSEYAVGYATLYGDMNGALAPIGDVYKTDVYSLAKWLNRSYFKSEIIPDSIISKPPSAELRPGQKDSDSLPPYEILDSIIYHYVELQRDLDEISDQGFEAETIQKIISLIDRQEFKRFQAAPIIKLTSKSFGTGRRLPLAQNWP